MLFGREFIPKYTLYLKNQKYNKPFLLNFRSFKNNLPKNSSWKEKMGNKSAKSAKKDLTELTEVLLFGLIKLKTLASIFLVVDLFFY